ncbi:response regulator [Ilyomonas limi]|uniref:Response regulator n=1 Tax=Ilyomonas limi TaxID=2575867 RepID=A0A4U3L2T8_9BACT|nr:response regulator [Ilyomonas limi]TKK69230.1 response regulator [Ilyomonas limi]
MQIPPRFILIDDEMYSNKISKTFIKKMFPDAEIVDFTSPLEALQYINTAYTTRPVSTAILLDINMPELNGWQVLEKLQALPLPVKDYISVYMLSSSIDPKDKQRAEDHPLIKGYIEKPLSREILQEIFVG